MATQPIDDREDDALELDTPADEPDPDVNDEVAEQPGDPAEEQAIYFEGDEAAEDDGTPLIKTLRERLRESERENRLLRGKSEAPADPGPKPSLEALDWDTDRYEAELFAWNERKQAAKSSQTEEQKQRERVQTELNEQHSRFVEQKKAIQVPDFERAEAAVMVGLSIAQQNVIVLAANNKAAVVYALGKSPARLAELAKIENPVRLAAEIARMEGSLKVVSRKSAPAIDAPVKGSGSLSVSTKQKKIDGLYEKMANGGDTTALRAQIAQLRAG